MYKTFLETDVDRILRIAQPDGHAVVQDRAVKRIFKIT